MFTAALLTIAKIREQPKCPSVDEWIKKMWCIYAMEFYSAVKKKKEILPFSATWMDLEGITRSERSHTEKDIPYDFIYMWKLKTKQINKREQNDGCQRGGRLGSR